MSQGRPIPADHAGDAARPGSPGNLAGVPSRPYTGPVQRAWCPRCRRAAALCWCPTLTPFQAGVDFAILMHPKEAKVAIGTGRMTHRALIGSRLYVGDRFEGDARLAALLDDPTLAPAILYPRPGALDLTTATSEAARAVFPTGRRPLIVVVDGTWTTAKKVLRQSPSLLTLPAIAFTPEARSRYDCLRKEPRPECCSTIEAAYWVIERLGALGIAPVPEGRAHEGLLTALDTVVAAQMAFEPPEHRDATRGPRDATSPFDEARETTKTGP